MPTFFAIIWNSGKPSLCLKRAWTDGGTVMMRTPHERGPRAHVSASASGGRSAGGFHSTRTSSAGTR